MTYEKIELPLGGEVIKKINEDGSQLFIPIDPANSDYQRYLRWVENPDADESGTLS